jgi:hypothetical protein
MRGGAKEASTVDGERDVPNLATGLKRNSTQPSILIEIDSEQDNIFRLPDRRFLSSKVMGIADPYKITA